MATGLFAATNPNPIRLIQSSYLTCKAPNLTPLLFNKSKQKQQHMDDWISKNRGPRTAAHRFKTSFPELLFLMVPQSPANPSSIQNHCSSL
ncbi:hypothetical protein PRUPE_1G173800 [Prunus persica]|uniref:Uncharacterized protein n=1 Tax=Prunus persica TaxID=3760 RepID=A0A251QZ20_PRUPE|nr:hypothetical protein PRUPE_1G173800 [Prunus persica]